MTNFEKKLASLLFGLISLCAVHNSVTSHTLSSVSIIQATLKGVSQCMHYKVVGLCVWLQCKPLGCAIETTLKIDQYLPDVVVSVYTQPYNNPWTFAQHIDDPAFYQAGQAEMDYFKPAESLSGGDEADNSPYDNHNKFHEVDIIGNPALMILGRYQGMLTSTARPYTPYYSSLLDAYAWRFPGLERFYPGSLIPGLHEVGKIALHDWGPVYPRNGYVNQPNDAKAAAVDALRASTIITALGQPHLYNPLSNDCGSHCYVYPVQANSPNAQYQMIYPKVETQCVVFGGNDRTHATPWETDAAIQGHNRYIWLLWRHYRGCINAPKGHYLKAIDFQ